MFRALALGFAASIVAVAGSTTDDEIASLVRRIEVLSAKESVRPRIDTELRAAELLKRVDPTASARFRSDAMRLAAGQKPAVRVGRIAELMNRIEELVASGVSGTEVPRGLKSTLQSAAGQFLAAVEHSDEDPADYDWLCDLRRRYDLTTGSDNASVRSRDALRELAALVDTDYDFRLRSVDSGEVTLQEQRGKVVLLSFWATWCAPCVEELPALERMDRELRERGLVVLAVTDEDPGEVRAFLKQNGITFPVLLDPARTVFEHYRIQALPAARIIDATGRLRAESDRVAEPELRRLVQSAGLACACASRESR